MHNYNNNNGNEQDNSDIVASNDAIIKEQVNTINRLYQEGGEKLEEIGEIAILIGFNNDSELASSRDPHKPQSYRKLVNHPDLEVSTSTLNRCVRVAVQSRFLKEKGIAPADLSHAQKRMLILMEDGEAKAELAKKIIAEPLSRSQIKPLIPKKPRKPKQQQEPKPVSKVDQTFSGLQALTGIDTISVVTEISDDREALTELRKEVERVTVWAAELIRKIEENCVKYDTAESDHEEGENG